MLRKKILLIGLGFILLIVGCEDLLQEDDVYGCTDTKAVNYNSNVNIDDGFHIYSVHPDKSLSPSYIEFSDSTFFSQIGIMHEPKTVKYFDKNFNQNIHYHKGSIALIQDLKISDQIPPGKYTIDATFIYLACDPTKCIPKFDDFSYISLFSASFHSR